MSQGPRSSYGGSNSVGGAIQENYVWARRAAASSLGMQRSGGGKILPSVSPGGLRRIPPSYKSISGRIPNRIYPDPDPIWDPCCQSTGHAGPRVCWLDPEPQGTPNHTFLPLNGSPCHHLGHGSRDPTQNSGPDLAVGVPDLNPNFFFTHFGPSKCPNPNIWQVFELP